MNFRVLLCFICGSAITHAFSFELPYMRMQTDGQKQTLETAVKWFSPADERLPKIVFVATTHVGEPSYYAELQKLLDSMGHVLYEESTPEASKAIFAHIKNPICDQLEGLTSGHRLEARAWGLKPQMDTILYNRSHFIRSDFDLDKIRDGVLGPAVHFPSFLCKAVLASLPSYERTLRERGFWLDILDQFNKFIKLNSSTRTPIGYGNTILLRNAQVVRDLQNLLSTGTRKNVAILYGAAHMDDMEQQIRDWGWRLVKEDWHVVHTAQVAR